jgi:hypothetical protein
MDTSINELATMPLESKWEVHSLWTRDEYVKKNFIKMTDLSNLGEVAYAVNFLSAQAHTLDEKLVIFVREGSSFMMEENSNMKGGHTIKYLIQRNELKGMMPGTPHTKFQHLFRSAVMTVLGEDNPFNGAIVAIAFSFVKGVCKVTTYIDNTYKAPLQFPILIPNERARVEKFPAH